MASQSNEIDDLLELLHQAKELNKARETRAESLLLFERIYQAIESLRRHITDLRKAGRYAEAVPLAERFAQVTEVRDGAESATLAHALIGLAELLIAADRSADAEAPLQRALVILLRQPEAETALPERFRHIDTGNPLRTAPALRELLSYIHETAGLRMPRRLSAREPYSAAVHPEVLFPEPGEAAVSLGALRSARAEAYRTQRVPEAPAPTTPEEYEPPVQASAIPAGAGAYRRFQDTQPQDPSTPEGALAIEAGRLVYQIPNQMWVGVQETVEVRLGGAIANEIMQGFIGRGDVRVEDTPIVETMKVSLVSDPGKFDIEPRSEEAQLVKPDLVKGTPLHLYDFGRWQWLVTPRQRGKHTLSVKVSAAIRDSRGLPTTSSLPDKTITVEVSVHLVQATVGVIRYTAPLVVSGLITALVSVFTKDYWWPYVRDTVWPAVAAFAGL